MTIENMTLYLETLQSFAASAETISDEEEDVLIRELDRLWYSLSAAEQSEVEAKSLEIGRAMK